MQHFAVIAAIRSGSTRLCEILGRHPEIACHQEIFHPHEVQAYYPRDQGLEILDRARRDADPAAFLERFLDFAQTRHRNRAWHGFKVLIEDGQARAATQVVCPNARLSKIVLRRDNLLASYTSVRLAIETGVWQRSADAPPDNGSHRVEFKRRQFLAFAGLLVLAHGAIMAALRRNGHRVLELEYGETLTPEGLARVWRFLGVRPIEEPGSLGKVNMRPLLECYKNLDAVRETMMEIGHTDWLAGDEPPRAKA